MSSPPDGPANNSGLASAEILNELVDVSTVTVLV
jgi:hypothetical protein